MSTEIVVTEAEETIVEKFRQLCVEHGRRIVSDDDDPYFRWEGLSVGFLMANGVLIDRARELAVHIRYTKGYWMKEWRYG